MPYTVKSEDLSDVEKAAAALVAFSPKKTLDGNTRVQKLAFLLSKTSGDQDLDLDFDFQPWDFGPYSENLDCSIIQLEDYGILAKNPKANKYTLTPDGDKVVKELTHKNPGLVANAKRIAEELSHLSTDDLVGIIYELYPSFATKSMIKDKVEKCNMADSLDVPLTNLKEGETIIIKSRCGKTVSAKRSGRKLILEEVCPSRTANR